MDIIIKVFKEIIYLGATASILILLIQLLKKLFHKVLTPKWHYYIWILLIVRLIVPYAPESPVSIFNLFYMAAEKVNLPVSELNNPLQDGSEKAATNDNISSGDGTTDTDTMANTDGVTIPNAGAATPNTDQNLQQRAMSGLDPINLMAYLWLMAVILLSAYTIGVNVIFAYKVRKNYTAYRDERMDGILEECKNIMKIKRPIALLTSESMRTPSLYVFITPKILVSKNYMEQLSDSEVRYIFLHELAHYKRKDIAVNWVLTLLQIIYCFQPLVWYAIYKIHEDCEISCDAEALIYLREDEYQAYGSTVIKLLKLFSESNFIPATAGIAKNKSSYRRRIIMISNFKKGKWIGSVLTVLLIIALGAVGLTGCSISPNDKANAAADGNTIGNADNNNQSEDENQSNDQGDTEGVELAEGVYDMTNPPSTEEENDNTADEELEEADIPQDSNVGTGEDSNTGTEGTEQEAGETENSSQNNDAADNTEDKVYYGDWVISQVLAYGSAGTYSSEEAESLIGTSLSFTKDKASCFGDQASALDIEVSNPVYSENVITNSDMVNNYRMNFEKLGITTESVTEVSVADTQGNACSFLVKDDNTLILVGGGTYFELTRK
ncbi:MAG: peptidase BlaR1 [Herbinix sp.]|jgi:bla regulator protein BlaR1|nr:peptidase BlaR1 [Herbinix sp.]